MNNSIQPKDYSFPMSLADYKKMRDNYPMYEMVHILNTESAPFKFCAKNDEDAIACLKNLKWTSMYRLQKINYNSPGGYDVVGIFIDNVWHGKKQ